MDCKMIKRGSLEWNLLLRNFKASTTKSNRDYLCVRCWKVFTYEQIKIHRNTLSDHNQSVVTSKHFATEEKFIQLAMAFDKYKTDEGKEFFETPYKKNIRKQSNNISKIV